MGDSWRIPCLFVEGASSGYLNAAHEFPTGLDEDDEKRVIDVLMSSMRYIS